jgi:hypothetical protein
MSLTAQLSDGSVKIAKDVVKENGPFYCSFCNEEMILRKGMVKIPHFAHKQGSTCAYSTGETLEHEWAKLNLFMTAEKMGINAFIEKKLSDHVRADVLLDFGDQKVAVEFQKSGMSVEQCKQRLQKYEETGIPVIWIFLLKDVQNFEGNIKWRKSVDTKIAYFSKIYESIYKDDTIKEGDFYEENVVYIYERDGYIGVWRLIDITKYKIFKTWEKIGRISLFDKDKFRLLKVNGTEIWKVNIDFLLGPNILDMRGKTIVLWKGDEEVIEDISYVGIKSPLFGDEWITWAKIIEDIENGYFGHFNFEIWYKNLEHGKQLVFLKPLFIPDTFLKNTSLTRYLDVYDSEGRFLSTQICST